MMRNFTIDILSDGCFQSSFGLDAGVATSATSRLQNRPIVDGFIICSDCLGQSAADGDSSHARARTHTHTSTRARAHLCRGAWKRTPYAESRGKG